MRSLFYRVADLEGSMETTASAFGVVAKAKSHLDDTTMSMKWEVFGWPQKVKKVVTHIRATTEDVRGAKTRLNFCKGRRP